MKYLYSLILSATVFSINAQIINIPDANFKAKLLQASTSEMIASVEDANSDGLVGTYTTIDTNGDGEIQLSEAQAIKYLDLVGSNISNLEGINSFSNLTVLYCHENSIVNLNLNPSANLKRFACSENLLTGMLDLTIFPNLQTFDCRFNQLTALNLQGLSHLKEFICDANRLTSLDVSNLPSLTGFECTSNLLTEINTNGSTNISGIVLDDNPFTALDFSGLINLIDLEFYNCHQLMYLNIKNGRHVELESSTNSSLRYICIDDAELSYIQWYLQYYNMPLCQANSYCSFEPGGRFYTIQGNNHVDYDNNGCDSNDLNYPNLNFALTDGTISGNIISDASGHFELNLIPGTYTITPVLENPNYFNISPTSLQLSFPGQASPLTQDFCITPNGNHKDVEVTLIPLSVVRPGFDARYKIVYKNKGNVPVSGSVRLNFNDSAIDFVLSQPALSTQSFGNLNWDYVNLLPYQSREIIIILNVNSPMETPAVNIGDPFSFTASVSPVMGDEMPRDNECSLKQIVVGSIDPNDKTCVEGSIVGPEVIGEYVHYVIRFENTGTFAAENIVVKDIIDTDKFDISTLVPLNASHSFVSRVTNANQVEFIFENINLPFDDANNDGYINFKIKTKSSLTVGDSFSNSAAIYFDYNFPVITDAYTSTIHALGNQDFDFGNYFSLYPNPAKNVLHINKKLEMNIRSISIYNMLGQLIQTETNPNEIIDVSGLKTGSYFIKVFSDKGTASSKFIKE